MPRSHGPKPKSIPIAVGYDPALWRFGSLHEALEINSDLIARLIRVGEEQSHMDNYEAEIADAVPMSESA